MNTKKPGRLCLGQLAGKNKFGELFALLIFELGSSAANPSFLSGHGKPFFRSLPYHSAFKFCKRGHDLHHHTACGGGRVDGFGQAAKACPSLINLFHEQ